MRQGVFLLCLLALTAFARESDAQERGTNAETGGDQDREYPNDRYHHMKKLKQKISTIQRGTMGDAGHSGGWVLVVVPRITEQIFFFSPLVLLCARYQESKRYDKTDDKKASIPKIVGTIMTFNAIVWITFALLAWDRVHLLANVSAFVLGLAFIVLHHVLYPSKADSTPSHIAFLAGSSGLLAALPIVCPHTLASGILGYTGAISTVAFYTTPLVALSSNPFSSLSPTFTNLGFINACMWTAVGASVTKDWLLWVPYGLGAIMSAVQMLIMGAIFLMDDFKCEKPKTIKEPEKESLIARLNSKKKGLHPRIKSAKSWTSGSKTSPVTFSRSIRQYPSTADLRVTESTSTMPTLVKTGEGLTAHEDFTYKTPTFPTFA
ncbi:hypothetical protein AAMO2058_000711300 [Amorphochlora amoebiformis]